jgi:terminase small subunit-like protein
MIEHRRLQIDARKWMAGKLRPRKYGDKQPDPDGAAGENKLVIEVRGGMPPDEIEGGGG